MPNILIYGGSFDPPTLAHIKGVEHALSELEDLIDEVWILPVSSHRFKNMNDPNRATFDNRMDMCRIAFSSHNIRTTKPVRVLAYDMLSSSGSTYEMLAELKKIFYANRYLVLIGKDVADVLQNSWASGFQLTQEHQFVVLPRYATEPDPLQWYLSGPHVYLELFPLLNYGWYTSISSSTVRNTLVSLNLALCGGYLDPGVLSFIIEKHLYGTHRGLP